MTRAQIADPEFANKVQRGPRGRDHPLHPRQPGLHRPRVQGDADRVHGQSVRRPRGTARGTRRGRDAGALARRRRRPGRDEGGGHARAARARVTLIEREAGLGGQVNLILRTPGRDEFGWITRDLGTQLGKHGVDVRLGTEATPELVRELAPDGVIVATGAVPSRTGFSSVNPLVDGCPESTRSNVLTVVGRAARVTARRRSASSSSTTTGAATPPGSPRCCSTAAPTSSSSPAGRRCSPGS